MAQSKTGFADTGQCVFFDDFLLSGSATTSAPDTLTVQDTSSAGTPVISVKGNEADGVLQILHDSTSEAQNIGVHWNDNLMIPAGKGWVVEARLKLVIGSGASLSADQRFVFGVASARNATLDSVADAAWLRIEGASNDWVLEGDDGTTNTDDQASSPTTSFTDDVFQVLKIDGRDLSAVRFSIDGTDVGTVDVSGLAATDGLQIFCELQRDAGTETDACEIDYIRAIWSRT